MQYNPPKVIAEIGCNHLGEIKIAKDLISKANQVGANYVKFQKRCNEELLSEEEFSRPHPVPENSYGQSYGDHRNFLEFSLDQHVELFDYCNTLGIGYSTSVWDCTSAKEIVSLNPKFIKVPSACNNNFRMLEILRDDYSGQVQLSVGMTTKNEIDDIVNFFELDHQAEERLLLYSCTSGYPVKYSDVALLEIKMLQEKYGDRVVDIGFSGHHLGIAIDIAAYTLGATWIERHFTLDRTWKGTDHAASLEPQGLEKLIRDLNNCYASLNYKSIDILDVEAIQREKLKYKSDE